MTTNNTPNEEVDLGQLFKVIGNGFRNLFKSIGNLFKSIFHYFIVLLIFLKNNLLYLGIATLIGGLAGYVLDVNKKPYFKSEMVLKTNYGSANRLNDQKVFISNLLKEEDSITLAKYFDIKPTQAASLLGFEFEPYQKDKNLLVDFDYYMERRDTNYVKDFTFKDFVKRTSDNDLRFQKITFYATDNSVFPLLSQGLKNGVENEFYKNIKDISVEKLKLKRHRLEIDLNEIDSLRNNYKKVALLEAKNSNFGGTNVNLSTKSLYRNNNDITLFTYSKRVLLELEKLKQEEDRSGEIVTIVSHFENGKEVNLIKYKKWFRFAILGFLLMTLFILGKQFNTYLNNYKN